MLRSAFLATLCFTAVCSDLGAQARHGFWMGIGWGGAWSSRDGIAGGGQKWSASYLRMGGTPARRLRVGGEVFGVSDGGLSRVNVALVVERSFTSTFYVKAGAGVASMERELVADGGTGRLTAEAVGLTSGIGLDLAIGPLVLAPAFDWMFQGRRTLDRPGGAFSAFALSLGIGIP